MTKFIIRSMTTTDFDWRTQKPVTPYHIYLMPRERRQGAFWCSWKGDAMKFDTFADAKAEVERYALKGRQIVPVDYQGAPYWENNADVEG